MDTLRRVWPMKLSGLIIDLYLLDLLLLMQLKTRFGFLDALPHHRLMFILLSTTTPQGISAELYFSLFCHRRLIHPLCRTFHFIKSYKFISSPIFEPTDVSPYNGSSFPYIYLSSQLDDICRLDKGAFNPDIQITYKGFEKYWTQYRSFI